MKNLNALYEECKKELDTLNIPYSKPTPIYMCNSASYAGQTQRRRNKYGGWNYTIKITRKILGDETLVKGVKQTIIHELLHTCPDCWSHKDDWKGYVEIVNKQFGYNISRCAAWEEYGLTQEGMKECNYQLHCEKCGVKWRFTRTSKLVKHPDWYRCKCGGKIIKDF